jgi:cellulose binding protein with CBM2 domain
VSGQDPDPLEVVLDPSVDEQYADSGPYRGRRRHLLPRHRPARRWASAWGIGTVLATIGVLLVGSGVLARTLATAQPDLPLLPPSPSSSSPELLDDRVAAGDRSDRPAPQARSSPSPGPADEQPASPPGSPERDDSGDGPAGPTDPGSEDSEPPGAPPAACTVAVDLDRWDDGYLASFVITNQGEPLDGWTMTVTVPDDVSLDEGFNGRWSQQGTTLTVENAPFNGTVGTGQSVVTGHSASHDGDVSFTGFILNGTACATS